MTGLVRTVRYQGEKLLPFVWGSASGTLTPHVTTRHAQNRDPRRNQLISQSRPVTVTGCFGWMSIAPSQARGCSLADTIYALTIYGRVINKADDTFHKVPYVQATQRTGIVPSYGSKISRSRFRFPAENARHSPPGNNLAFTFLWSATRSLGRFIFSAVRWSLRLGR